MPADCTVGMSRVEGRVTRPWGRETVNTMKGGGRETSSERKGLARAAARDPPPDPME
jgi:hypothetical protein